MKKSCIAALLLVLLILLVGCGKTQEVPKSGQYTTDGYGVCYVNGPMGTINIGSTQYRFALEGDQETYTITVYYPNGRSYVEECRDGVIAGGYDDPLWEPGKEYVSGDTATGVLRHMLPKPEKMPIDRYVMAAVLILLGFVGCRWPRLFWILQHRWAVRDSDPSDLYLGVTVAGCSLMIAIGALMLLL